VTYDPRLDETITLKLKRDEAIVLLWYLTRELWKKDDDNNLSDSFVHAAEPHSLDALIQVLFPPLSDTGAPEAEGVELAAREHLLKRYT